jgi:hypothetical protein
VQAYDLSILGARLGELAEVFEKKQLSEKALAVWFDTLKEFQIERVASLLIVWPKTHTKFPAPAEVWKAVNDMGIGERELKAQRENKETFYPGVGGAQAEKFIAQIKQILKRPRWSPREHWERVLDTAKPESIGQRYAKQALMNMGARTRVEREPGQDDEEKAVNF